jgi:hypothetical protein
LSREARYGTWTWIPGAFARTLGDDDRADVRQLDNDAERLCFDPAMRHLVGGRASQPEKQAASTSEVGQFETEILSTKENLTALMNLSGQWIDQVHRRPPLNRKPLANCNASDDDARSSPGWV